MQVFLAKIGIFVNYDYFYVNTIMSTRSTKGILQFVIFNYFQDVGADFRLMAQHIGTN